MMPGPILFAVTCQLLAGTLLALAHATAGGLTWHVVVFVLALTCETLTLTTAIGLVIVHFFATPISVATAKQESAGRATSHISIPIVAEAPPSTSRANTVMSSPALTPEEIEKWKEDE